MANHAVKEFYEIIELREGQNIIVVFDKKKFDLDKWTMVLIGDYIVSKVWVDEEGWKLEVKKAYIKEPG